MTSIYIYIFLAIFICLGAGSLIFAIFKEKLSKNSIIFCIRTLLFWVVSGYITYYTSNKIHFEKISGFNLYILMIVNSYLFSLIFRPILSLVIKKINSQKKVMIGIQLFQYLAIIILIISMSVKFNIWLIFIMMILYGVFYSLLVTEYLFFNDQFFFKINTFAVVYIITCIYGLGKLIGMTWNSLSQIFDKQILTYNILTIIFLLAFTSISIFLTFQIDEDKSLIGTYDEILKSKLQHCNKRNIIIVSFCSLLISVAYAILSSTTFKVWLISNLHTIQIPYKQIIFVQNVFDIRSLFILSCLTYPFYYFFLKKANANIMLLIDFFLAIISLAFIMIFKSIWIYLIFGYIINFCVTQLFYFVFSLSIVWFYRSNGIRLFNIFWILAISGIYICLLIENILILKDKFISLQQIYDYIKENRLDINLKNKVELIGIIILFILSFFLSTIILIIFFFYKDLIGDNIEINRSINILKKTIQDSIIEKSKQRMEYEFDIQDQQNSN